MTAAAAMAEPPPPAAERWKTASLALMAAVAAATWLLFPPISGSFTAPAPPEGCHPLTRNVEDETQNNRKGCILYMDSRSVALNSSKEAMGTSFEDLGDMPPYWIISKFINRHYAIVHGYRFIATNGKDFHDTLKPRAQAWYKVKFAKQQLQCCCQWVIFLDSDAYFRMENHALSIDQWLAKLTTQGYFSLLENQGVDMRNQTWFPEDPLRILDPPESATRLIGLFPRNGDNKGGFCGGRYPRNQSFFFPQPPESCIDFINSGIFMLRNSTLTHQFLEDWFNDPSSDYFLEHPWEQHRLNRICHRYRDNLVLVPFMEFTGPTGRQVRHFWSRFKKNSKSARHRMLQIAALGLLTYFESKEPTDT